MLGIGANNHYFAPSFDQLAFFADGLYRCSYFHFIVLFIINILVLFKYVIVYEHLDIYDALTEDKNAFGTTIITL